MKKQQYFVLFMLSIAVIAIALTVVAAESRFLAGAQRWFDRRCERDRVADSTAFDCYLFEQVQSLIGRALALEEQVNLLQGGPKTTMLLGNPNIEPPSAQLPIPDNGEVLAGEYTGSGTLKYLVAASGGRTTGVRIEIDGNTVARSLSTSEFSGEGWSHNANITEVNTPYAFTESLKIFLFNDSGGGNRGAIHAEVEAEGL